MPNTEQDNRDLEACGPPASGAPTDTGKTASSFQRLTEARRKRAAAADTSMIYSATPTGVSEWIRDYTEAANEHAQENALENICERPELMTDLVEQYQAAVAALKLTEGHLGHAGGCDLLAHALPCSCGLADTELAVDHAIELAEASA